MRGRWRRRLLPAAAISFEPAYGGSTSPEELLKLLAVAAILFATWAGVWAFVARHRDRIPWRRARFAVPSVMLLVFGAACRNDVTFAIWAVCNAPALLVPLVVAIVLDSASLWITGPIYALSFWLSWYWLIGWAEGRDSNRSMTTLRL